MQLYHTLTVNYPEIQELYKYIKCHTVVDLPVRVTYTYGDKRIIPHNLMPTILAKHDTYANNVTNLPKHISFALYQANAISLTADKWLNERNRKRYRRLMAHGYNQKLK